MERARRFLEEEIMHQGAVAEHGLRASEFSYRVSMESGYTEYHMVLSRRDAGAERRLAAALSKNAVVLEFRLSPSGD